AVDAAGRLTGLPKTVIVALQPFAGYVPAARCKLCAQEIKTGCGHGLVARPLGEKDAGLALKQTLQSRRFQKRRPATVRMPKPDLVRVVRIRKHLHPILVKLIPAGSRGGRRLVGLAALTGEFHEIEELRGPAAGQHGHVSDPGDRTQPRGPPQYRLPSDRPPR